MNIAEKIHAARDQLRSRTQSYRANAVEGARRSALRAAERVSAARRPVRALAAAGRQLSSLSNRYIEQLIGQQAHALEGILEGGVERLKRAAKADSLRGFVSDQATLWNSSRERLGSDLQATWKITRDAGRDLRDLTAQTYTALRHGSKPAARATTKAKKKRKSRKPSA